MPPACPDPQLRPGLVSATEPCAARSCCHHAQLQPRPDVPLWGQMPYFRRLQHLGMAQELLSPQGTGTRAQFTAGPAHTRLHTTPGYHSWGGGCSGAAVLSPPGRGRSHPGTTLLGTGDHVQSCPGPLVQAPGLSAASPGWDAGAGVRSGGCQLCFCSSGCWAGPLPCPHHLDGAHHLSRQH